MTGYTGTEWVTNAASVVISAASGSEAAPCPQSGSVLQRLSAQRQPDRQELSGLPGKQRER